MYIWHMGYFKWLQGVAVQLRFHFETKLVHHRARIKVSVLQQLKIFSLTCITYGKGMIKPHESTKVLSNDD